MRTLCVRQGAAFCVGELTSAKALVLGDKKSRELLLSTPGEQPFGCQLFGGEPDILAEAARIAGEYSPRFVDINMGCPAPKITQEGAGAALARDPETVRRVVSAVVKAVKLPVTVKIRSGWDGAHINAVEVAKAAEYAGAAAVTVHARTRAQGYAPPVDLAVIAAVKRAVSVPVIANGDIRSGGDAARVIAATGCDRVAVGRAAMGDPFLFARINAYLAGEDPPPPPTLRDRVAALLEQTDIEAEARGERAACLEARRQAGYYLKGLRGSSDLRAMCSRISCREDLLAVCRAARELNPEA